MNAIALRGAVIAALLALAGCAGPMVAGNAQQVTKQVLSDDGLSELSVPESWVSRPDVVRSATLRLGGEASDVFLVVNTYPHGELQTTPAAFARSMADNLAEALGNGRVTAQRTLSIGGRPAHEYVVSGGVEDGLLTYVSTVVEGERSLHNLLGWTASADYSGRGHVLHKAIATFRESATPRQAKQRVDLTFDWPEQLDYTTRFHGKSKKRSGSYELKGVYRNSVRPSGDHYLQVQTRVQRQEYVSDNPGRNDSLQKVLDQISSQVPDYLITREGEFAQVQDLAEFQRRMERALFDGLPKGEAGASGEMVQRMKAALSEQFLAAAAMDEWNRSVGGWIDSAYVVGEVYPTLEEYRAPALGERNYPMRVTRQLAGTAPCFEGDTSYRCVHLIYTGTVSDASFRADMARFLESVVGPAVKLNDVVITRRTDVISHPQTLLPFRTVSTETKTITLTDPTGEVVSNEDREEITAIYSYQESTAAR